jgi:hypothetical protein
MAAKYPDTPTGKAREHKDKQARRLRDAGHSVGWRKVRTADYYGICRRCGGEVECDEYGTHWRGGNATQSFLKFMGVNIIRRCPGAR